MAKRLYSGLYLPDGRIPQNLKGDYVQQENDYLNDETYLAFQWQLYDLAISVFEWEGLPKGVNKRLLETWLLYDGRVLFAYDEAIKQDPDQRSPEGYAVFRVAGNSDFTIYNIPKKRIAYTVDPQHAYMEFDITNSVIGFNDSFMTPTMLRLNLYAKMLWQCERTVYTNIAQQKTPRIIKCTEKQRLTMKNMFMQVDGFMPTVWADSTLDTDAIDVLDTASPFVADNVQIIKHQIWNEALSYLGIENVNTDKRERLVSGEVDGNMGDVEANRYTRLNVRKEFCEEINEMFGLNVSCKFREGFYIKGNEAKGGEVIDE